MSAQLSSSDIKDVQGDKLRAVVDLARALEALDLQAKALLKTVAQAEQGLVPVRLCQLILIERDDRNRPKHCEVHFRFCSLFSPFCSVLASDEKYFPSKTYRKKMEQVGKLILQHKTAQEVRITIVCGFSKIPDPHHR
jgi:hypothetical protein